MMRTVLLCLTLPLMALAQEPPLPIKPVRAAMTDIVGKPAQIPAPNAKATVLLFVAVDCPIGNRFAPEIARLQKEYAEKGVPFYRVYTDTTMKNEQFIQHGKDYKLDFPAVLDTNHKLVKALGVSVTPQAVVLLKDGTPVYRGRINDLYLEHGQLRGKPTREDLRIALDEVLAGKPVSIAITRAVGCDIPDLG